ncbi:class I SAM-dependent methyltransferase [Cellulomonas sp. KRMCY2]|uniref:class I SAM-dependent methyltransferase n=1 Tax=Cellulomonas sp. KRMCY2 TaxID=1304865 RepID=UPI00045EAA90|nr:class I SAM-dependent methyltransferase [Cellulomonas sp. KRMCY2]
MTALPDEIREHYEHHVDEDARLRGGLGRLEHARVQEIVRRHLTAGPQRVPDVGGATFDVALMFGPLYHLPERADRVAAWREAARVVVPGGLVLGMAISRFASLFDGLAQGHLFEPRFRTLVEADLATGRHENPTGDPGWFTTAYFHRPEELRTEADDAGLEVLEVVGVEGLAPWLRHLASRWDEPADRQAILQAARVIEVEPSVLGLSPHLVAVARRR